MVKAHPPHGPALKFQGRRDYLPEPGPDDWGLTPEQQASSGLPLAPRALGTPISIRSGLLCRGSTFL